MRLVGSDLPSKSNLIPSIQCAWGRGGGPPAPSSVRGTHYPPQTPIPQHQDRMNPSLPCSETVRNRSQSAGHRMKVVALQCSCAPVGSVQSNWHHQRQILHWSPDASGRRRCNWSVSTTTSPPLLPTPWHQRTRDRFSLLPPPITTGSIMKSTFVFNEITLIAPAIWEFKGHCWVSTDSGRGLIDTTTTTATFNKEKQKKTGGSWTCSNTHS